MPVERLLHGLAGDDVGRLQLEGTLVVSGDRPLVVDRTTEAVDDATEEAVAHRHREDAAGLLDRIALLDPGGLSEDDAADLGFLQVERDAEQSSGELEELVRHRL